MHMIRDTAYAVTFAISITRHGGKIGEERRADRGIKGRRAVFGAEDNVDEQE